MRVTTGLIMLLVSSTLVVGMQHARSQDSLRTGDRTADEAAIREQVQMLETGWNKKDGTLFAQPFAPDADYVVINGAHMRGRDLIARGHQQIFDTIYKDKNLDATVKQVRFLRPDVALVHITGTWEPAPGENKREPHSIVTMVMTRNEGVWRIDAFHNTPIVPQAQPQKQ